MPALLHYSGDPFNVFHIITPLFDKWGGGFMNDCFLICGFFLGTDSLVFVGWVDIGHCLGFFAPILSAARASAHVLYCLVHGVSTLLYLSNIACIAVIFLCNLDALYYL